MKYIKEYYNNTPSKFRIDDWVVPIASSSKLSTTRAYKITGEYSPEFCRGVNQYDGWGYSLDNDEFPDDYRTHLEKDLRRATPQEIMDEEIKRQAKKYNL